MVSSQTKQLKKREELQTKQLEKRKKLGQKLLEASEKGDLKKVKKIIEKNGLNPNFSEEVCKKIIVSKYYLDCKQFFFT